MLTSSANQYLRPEYLTPLPTTFRDYSRYVQRAEGGELLAGSYLDAKKSPLALLAQTCSQIGADSPNTKPLIPPLEKSNKSSKPETPREKASPASSIGSDVVVKSSFKPYESSTSREKPGSPEDRGGSASSGSRVRTPVSAKSVTAPGPGSGRCNSNHSASSPRSSPAAVGRKTPASSSTTPLTSNLPSDAPATSKSSSSESTARAASSPINSKVGFSPSLLSSASDPALKDLPLGTYKPGAGIPVSAASYLSAYPSHGAAFPMDVMASSLMSSHQHLKPGLNPYIGYARMKTPSGTDTLVPVCRDPYCTGCQLSSHLLASSGAAAAAAAAAASKNSAASSATSCPGGCAQCDHASAAGKAGFLPTPGHSPAAAAAYAHAQLAALAAASHLPYVCNWIAGDAAYCGKRFGSSDELLQHLRSHTNLGAAADSLLSAPHPLLHRTYPTPPLSPLATARYHPYSKPALLPPSLGFPLHPHPGLPPYFSPYSLYGQRLGAASSMHP